jgi:hypothetical protein
MFGQLPQQQELQPRQRYRAIADVRDQPPHIQGQLAGPDRLARPRLVARMPVRAQPDPHPGQELGQREWLGQVVLSTPLQAVDLGRHVSQAGQHHDRLIRPVAQQPIQDVAAHHVRHDQIQDDQVVVTFQRLQQPLGAGAREVGQVPGGRQRPADERTDVGFVVDDEDSLGGRARLLAHRGLFRRMGQRQCPPPRFSSCHLRRFDSPSRT